MESYGFFNGDTEYGQDEFNRYFKNIYEDGLSRGSNGSLTLSASLSGESVVLTPGFAIMQGFFYYNDSNKTIPITRNSTYKVIYRLVLSLDYESKTIQAVLKAGTAGSTPTVPALTRDASRYELSLYRIDVPVTGQISITDERFNTAVCGEIRPKNLTGYKEMVEEFDRQFQAWFKNVQGTGWRNIFAQATEPGGAVTGAIWISG